MALNNRILGALLIAGSLLSSGAQGTTVTWTDWTTIPPSGTTASGTMGGVTVSVSSTSAMDGPSQTGCGTNWWIQPNPADQPYTGGSVDNAPTACEQVALSSPNTITVSFSSPVQTLYMALLSVGQPGLAVTYDFNSAFVIDSEGQGYWGNDATNGVIGVGDTLTGREFHGLLMFTSPVNTLTFTTSPTEYWHAFTFAMAPTTVPEPGSLALMFLALTGIGMLRKKRVV